jgi:hypothetical protein
MLSIVVPLHLVTDFGGVVPDPVSDLISAFVFRSNTGTATDCTFVAD